MLSLFIPRFMRRRFLKIYQNFPYFSPYWAPKGASPFIWTTLNPHLPSMFPANFGWNWHSGSWEEGFLSIFPYILLCKSLSPWDGATHDPRDFIWTNLNPLAPRTLHTTYQCIPAIGSWEEDFWRFVKIFLILPPIGPQKGPAPYLNKSESPSPRHVFCQV